MDVVDTPFSDCDRRAVLFLCTGNCYRSRFAEFIFNDLAWRERLPHRALSRGLAPSDANPGAISMHSVEGLVIRGIDLPEPVRIPLPVRRHDLEAADLVVALDRSEHRPMLETAFPDLALAVEYWDVPDLHAISPTVASQRIGAHVVALLTRLEATGGPLEMRIAS